VCALESASREWVVVAWMKSPKDERKDGRVAGCRPSSSGVGSA
jgi:hypothetical protein